MFRSYRIALAILLLLVTVGAPAKPVPDLHLRSADGQPRSLSQLRGTPAVVSFWATWCGPCKEELPRLSSLQGQYAPQHVRFIAISVDERKDQPLAERWLGDHHVTLEAWVNGTTEMLDRVGLDEIVPGTLILDADGNVVTRISGEAREQDITGTLDWLLHGREGTPPAAKIKRY